MAWDIAVKTKVYHLLANEIFFRIYNGTYPLGVKLSSFPVFAKEVGSSPETVRKAIYELQKHGIVERNRLGFFVTSNHEKVFSKSNLKNICQRPEQYFSNFLRQKNFKSF